MDEYLHVYDFGGSASRNVSSNENDTTERNETSINTSINENSSVCSPNPAPQPVETENSRIRDLENYMGSQMSQVIQKITSLGNTIQNVNSQLQKQMSKVETELCTVKSKMSEIEHPDPEIRFNHQVTRATSSYEAQNESCYDSRNGAENNNCLSNGQNIQQSVHEMVPTYQNLSIARPTNNLKMRPQTYSGDEDLQDFLAQFQITTEINGWDYAQKSLYLASSLTGGARSLLSEMNERERRDFCSLEEKLKARFGSENKAEVFRTQLKSRVRGKGETIPEMAQSIRKMTRLAYPTGSQDVIEALSLDNFIDALNDSDIRLRLREIAPKTISEAEKIAVRMEAHRLADRNRNKLVCTVDKVNNSKENTASSSQVENSVGLERVGSQNRQTNSWQSNNGSKSQSSNQTYHQSRNRIQNENRSKYQRNGNYYRHYDNHRPHNNGFYNNGPNNSGTQNNRWSYQNTDQHRFNRQIQGNDNKSSWGDRSSTTQKGPKLH
ncbi:uncharacterized protein LOC123544673 [Mercenaria mercenaria]|uniref:uncharacterized protein LOC123544673 n=1 Tax=Mercenaria mercenaria TaxID=6596 RepID=UPI00234F1090|nr:uncharacterized protein LOC123544673 [Mercenaria mercenaria]